MKKTRLDKLRDERMGKSLEELENCSWGEPEFDSFLVTNMHRLRKVPLRELRVEDLRMSIGQKVGLRFLLPLALDALEQDPFVSGDLYPGDLLSSVAGSLDDSSAWNAAPELRQRFRRILERALPLLQETDAPDEMEDTLLSALDHVR